MTPSEENAETEAGNPPRKTPEDRGATGLTEPVKDISAGYVQAGRAFPAG